MDRYVPPENTCFLLWKNMVLITGIKPHCLCPSVPAPYTAKLLPIPAEPEGTTSAQLTRMERDLPAILVVPLSFSFLGSYVVAGFWWKPLAFITRKTFLSEMKPIGFSLQQHFLVCVLVTLLHVSPSEQPLAAEVTGSFPTHFCFCLWTSLIARQIYYPFSCKWYI